MASQPTLSCAISDKDRDASRWVLVLTKAGLHCFIKMRPIEQLSNRLGGPSFLEALRHPPVSNFSETDIYTMCLQVRTPRGSPTPRAPHLVPHTSCPTPRAVRIAIPNRGKMTPPGGL